MEPSRRSSGAISYYPYANENSLHIVLTSWNAYRLFLIRSGVPELSAYLKKATPYAHSRCIHEP